MSIDPAIKEKFIDLRAQGLSYARIADQLQVSKPTLIALSKECVTEIENLRAIYTEAFQDKYFARTDRRIELFGRRIESLLAELDRRKLEDLPTEKILTLLFKFVLALKPEEKSVIFRHPSTIQQLIKDTESVTCKWQT